MSGICDKSYSGLGGFPSFHFRIREILSSTPSADFARTFTSGNPHLFSHAISFSVRLRVPCHSVCNTLTYSASNCFCRMVGFSPIENNSGFFDFKSRESIAVFFSPLSVENSASTHCISGFFDSKLFFTNHCNCSGLITSADTISLIFFRTTSRVSGFLRKFLKLVTLFSSKRYFSTILAISGVLQRVFRIDFCTSENLG